MTWKTVSGAAKAAVLREAARLFKDNRGNSLAIIAAAIFPMLAAIGGGLDMARAYLVKSRINEACDSAALAGRRAMTGDDISTATVEANKFFKQNFPQRYLGSASFELAITKPETGTVKVAAQTTVPTTLMRLFGYTSLPVKVSCNATQTFDNIDIVLVLDLTSTMDDEIDGETKFESMKTAILALYKELKPVQDQLGLQGLSVRYGFVPYSSSVNVGKLIRDVDTSYIADNWTYRSRTGTKVGSNWTYTYGPKSVDVRSFANGNEVNTRTIVGGSGLTDPQYNKKWSGCIEERKTVSTITASSGTAAGNIPSGAYDLDIDLKPTSDPDTKWGPQFPEIVYFPSDDVSAYPEPGETNKNKGANVDDDDNCPPAAKRLTVMNDEAAVKAYTNGLKLTSFTYHDIGMIWGARFISRNGIFAADNPTVRAGRPVKRFIIHMTDGEPNPKSNFQTAYGVEKLAQRINGGTYDTKVLDREASDLAERHSVRYEMACNAAKKGGASIWTIMFTDEEEEDMSDSEKAIVKRLKACASNEDQMAISANGNALVTKFKEIAKSVGTLRISQ